jgi:sortase (surface protein transpeptidase)
MTAADSTPAGPDSGEVPVTDPAGNGQDARKRRGRYVLSAVVLALTAVGAVALTRGATADRQSEPPLAAVGATAPDQPSAPAPAASGGGGALTTCPQMDTSTPTGLRIPALKVDVALSTLGRQADGTMQVPTDAKTVGWYTGSPTPGSLGPAVLAGHVDFKGRPGTFSRLTDLKPADTVWVSRQDHSLAMFTVVKVERYAKDRFPTDAVYGPIDHAGLRLITCGGDFDSTAGHYKDNIVVYAKLTMAHPA